MNISVNYFYVLNWLLTLEKIFSNTASPLRQNNSVLSSILRMRRAIPWACLILIYWHVMVRIIAASVACGSARCAIYTSRGEAAMPRISLPLLRVYSQLLMKNSILALSGKCCATLVSLILCTGLPLPQHPIWPPPTLLHFSDILRFFDLLPYALILKASRQIQFWRPFYPISVVLLSQFVSQKQ